MTNLAAYIPENSKAEFHGHCVTFEVSAEQSILVARSLYIDQHLPLKLITATDDREALGCFTIWYVFFSPTEKGFVVPYLHLRNTTEFPSLTPFILEARHYERKINTFFGLTPVGHPDPRQLILHENWPTDVWPLRKDFDGQTQLPIAHGSYQFQKVDGEGIYEIPVGPIHAGIIEPGHFRFSVAGEEILLLEPRLGYVHKGTEKLFERLSLVDQIRLAEKISGDSSFSYALAFVQGVEQLGEITVPRRARFLRVLFAELERLANHFGDIGAMMLDTGYSFGGSHGARLREMILQINERLTGSRFLRGVMTVGGVQKDISVENQVWLADELAAINKDFLEVINIADNSVSLLNRLEGTGRITPEVVRERGIVGLAARATGVPLDVRVDLPYAAYDELIIGQAATETTGDAQARFKVRIQEVLVSLKLIQDLLSSLPTETMTAPKNIVLKNNAIAISCVEGWRGEIVYFITTDGQGHIIRVAPRDPSFMNWAGVGSAGVGNVVPDFPLINKSFNMSYSGNDL